MAFGQRIKRQTPERRRSLEIALVSATLAALAAAGCSSSEPPQVGTRIGLSCVDDSTHCISQREKVFDQFMADKSRGWLKETATPEAYASGVRLFALSKRRRELSCAELAHGKKEADAGPGILRSQGNGRLTPAQVSRGAMLASEVGRDLGRELDKRCRKT
ncbi:MAG: hypothetical protein ABL907_07715 [Hyphomicrobium sp.]